MLEGFFEKLSESDQELKGLESFIPKGQTVILCFFSSLVNCSHGVSTSTRTKTQRWRRKTLVLALPLSWSRLHSHKAENSPGKKAAIHVKGASLPGKIAAAGPGGNSGLVM